MNETMRILIEIDVPKKYRDGEFGEETYFTVNGKDYVIGRYTKNGYSTTLYPNIKEMRTLD